MLNGCPEVVEEYSPRLRPRWVSSRVLKSWCRAAILTERKCGVTVYNRRILASSVSASVITRNLYYVCNVAQQWRIEGTEDRGGTYHLLGRHRRSWLMSMARSQTIETLRLFRHSRNTSFRVFRKPSCTGELQKTHSVFGVLSRTPLREWCTLPRSPSWWGGACCPSPSIPPRLGPWGLVSPFLKNV